MSKQWYMTVGYPGGERAATHPGKLLDDVNTGYRSVSDERIREKGIAVYFKDAALGFFIRPCPPDVTEWLEATTGEVCDGRQKVPGGWLYLWSKCDYGQGYAALAQSFVPVPGTANITVLEANDD